MPTARTGHSWTTCTPSSTSRGTRQREATLALRQARCCHTVHTTCRTLGNCGNCPTGAVRDAEARWRRASGQLMAASEQYRLAYRALCEEKRRAYLAARHRDLLAEAG